MESDRNLSAAPLAGGRIPTGALAASLQSRVAEVLRVLQSASAEVKRNPPLAPAHLVERYGQQFEASMLALGEVLADFFDESDSPVNLDAVRANFLEPILALSRSLPIYQRAEDWKRNKDKTGELHELVLEGRLVGFDAETLLLDNFYENTVFARSLRTRVPALVRMFQEEATRQRTLNGQDLRVLVLGVNSAVNLAPPFTADAANGHFSLLIVDGDTQALRRARQRLEEAFGSRPAVLLARREVLESSLERAGPPFDIIYALMQYDMEPPQIALGLTRLLSQKLKPGGALLTGAFLPGPPRGYRAIAIAFADLAWQYWDETAWLDLLGQLPFDLSASRFEVIPPATITVLARRSTSEASR